METPCSKIVVAVEGCEREGVVSESNPYSSTVDKNLLRRLEKEKCTKQFANEFVKVIKQLLP